jgi:hypothetical protein
MVLRDKSKCAAHGLKHAELAQGVNMLLTVGEKPRGSPS